MMSRTGRAGANDDAAPESCVSCALAGARMAIMRCWTKLLLLLSCRTATPHCTWPARRVILTAFQSSLPLAPLSTTPTWCVSLAGGTRPYERFLSSLWQSCCGLTVCASHPAAIIQVGQTPLHIAASDQGSAEIVQALIAAGACADIPDLHGRTALHLAAAAGTTECIKALLKAGADRCAKTNVRFFPLPHCCWWGTFLRTALRPLVTEMTACPAAVCVLSPPGWPDPSRARRERRGPQPARASSCSGGGGGGGCGRAAAAEGESCRRRRASPRQEGAGVDQLLLRPSAASRRRFCVLVCC